MVKQVKKNLKGAVRAPCMAVLWPLEKILINQAKKPDNPVVFIIGPPRSGTTLIYELLVRKYKFSYMSNLAHRLYMTPVAATTLGKILVENWHRQLKSVYESRYGSISGWGAPSEGGWIWNRWFSESYYLDESHAANVPRQEIQNTVYGLCKAMNGPFINKNVMHSVHLRLLDQLFPKCLFIHINRDIKSNVRSIMRANSQDDINKNEWVSVKPREWEKYKNEDIVLRSAIQVSYIHKNIEEDERFIGSGRVFPVAYEDFCQNSGAMLDAICAFLNKNDVNIKERDIQLPELSVSSQKLFSEDIEHRIDECVNTLEKEIVGLE